MTKKVTLLTPEPVICLLRFAMNKKRMWLMSEPEKNSKGKIVCFGRSDHDGEGEGGAALEEDKSKSEPEPEPEWVDIHDELYNKRMVVLGEPIDQDVASQMTSIFLYLNTLETDAPIHLFINSPGGEARYGLAIASVMDYVKVPVHTACIGVAFSTAAFVLAGGESGNRFASPNSKISLYQPEQQFFKELGLLDMENPSFSIQDIEQVKALQKLIVDRYVQKTGKPESIIRHDMKKVKYMTPEQAQAYGIIDRIARNI
uniref:ATP-dependent Clp protease proteolytic subunit n=1 Tax=Silene noctiflora TaxID=39899 RepID=H2BLY1_9CARY|nr:clp protease proteolytic subunit [Silene noctiflora]AEC04182.1 clp protease proteolytic subunit [Silene noctiflora]WFF47180.1 clp protease proteolytic subunit [Silene noctiflora]